MSIANSRRLNINGMVNYHVKKRTQSDPAHKADVAYCLMNQAVAKDGYEIDGEPCSVAQYRDGSILAYYGSRRQHASRMVKGAAARDAAIAFLRDDSRGAVFDYGSAIREHHHGSGSFDWPAYWNGRGENGV